MQPLAASLSVSQYHITLLNASLYQRITPYSNAFYLIYHCFALVCSQCAYTNSVPVVDQNTSHILRRLFAVTTSQPQKRHDSRQKNRRMILVNKNKSLASVLRLVTDPASISTTHMEMLNNAGL
jgi:hypothetical protein